MAMLYEAFTEPEPHFAQILKADAITPIEVYPKAENHDPERGLGRRPDRRHAHRQQGGRQDDGDPQPLRARSTSRSSAGDEVTIHVTNVEQTTDMIHGLGIVEHDMNVVSIRARPRRCTFKADKAGVYPVLLHQLLLGAPPGDAGLPRRQAVSRPEPSIHARHRFAPSHALPRTARCRPVPRRGVVLLAAIARAARRRSAAAVAHPAGRAAVPEGLTLDMYSLPDRRRQRRPGPGRDQHAEPLHRDEADRAGRLRRDEVSCRSRSGSSRCWPCGRQRSGGSAPGRSRGAVPVFRAFSLGQLRVPAVELRPPSRSARADADRAVHAGRDRPQQIANFVQTSLPMAGTACMGAFLMTVVAAIWLSRPEELS